MPVFLLIALLVALIVAHEFGHFIVAKILKVYVKEFGIGYPPRAFMLGKIKETEYTINWLPFGGFVRLLEEDGTAPQDARRVRGSFASSPKWKQVLILLAGVFANAVFGWMLFTAGLMLGLPVQVAEYGPDTRLVVSEVVPGSPAEGAGFKPGDEIVQITDQNKRTISEPTPEAVVEFVHAQGGKSLDITYKRRDAADVVSVIPAHAVLPGMPSQPALGVGLVLISEKQLGFFEALWGGFVQTGRSLLTVAYGLASLILDTFNGSADIRTLVGPVGLVSQVGDAASHGLGQLFGLAALISINLVIINLLPIPALDGGRLLFIAIEAARGRKLSRTAAQIINTVGFLLVVLLMVAITYNDIARIIGS